MERFEIERQGGKAVTWNLSWRRVVAVAEEHRRLDEGKWAFVRGPGIPRRGIGLKNVRRGDSSPRRNNAWLREMRAGVRPVTKKRHGCGKREKRHGCAKKDVRGKEGEELHG